MEKATSSQKPPVHIEVKAIPEPVHRSRRPKWMQHIPWIAVISLNISILCLFASIAIVLASHGSVSEWHVEPHVVLGVLSSVATASLVVSLSTGVAITWWHALHSGKEANRLQSIWSYSPMGGGAYSMIRHGFKDMNKVAMASTLTAIAGLVYAPLLQRSSGIVTATVSKDVPLNMSIAPLLPVGWTGDVNSNFFGDVSAENQYSGIVQQWSTNNHPALLDQEGFACDGTCIGSVPSTGISYTCSNIKTSIPLYQLTEADNFYGFFTNYTRALDENSDPVLLLTVQLIDGVDDQCNANYITKTCTIQAGTVSYPIEITNTTITTNQKSAPITNFVPHPYSGDSPNATEATPFGPLGGLTWLGFNFLYTADQIAYTNTSTTSFTDYTNGTMAIQYYDYSYTNPNAPDCSYRWFDPSPDILTAFEEVLFWASVEAGNETEMFWVKESKERLVYTAVYSYLGVASVVLAAAVGSVAWTLWGWWRLEGEVSLNPLETARVIVRSRTFDLS